MNDIDPNLFTHLNYAFLNITPDGEIVHADKWRDLEMENCGMIRKFTNLKATNARCKMMASVGGATESQANAFQQVAASAETRNRFAENAVTFLKAHGFDGIDIHWLYPQVSDKENLVLLLATLQAEFKLNNFTLSIAVGATKYREDAYNVHEIARHVDFINLMTYELHGFWEGVTGSIAPLFMGSDTMPELNVDACVRHWRSKGAPDAKLVLGIATYGKKLKLVDRQQNGLGAAIQANEVATMTYDEIIQSGLSPRWDAGQRIPYGFKEDDWFTYENVRSVREKAEYVRNKILGGVMFSSISSDDYKNRLGEGNFPLVEAARGVIYY